MMGNGDMDPNFNEEGKSYILSGKLMLSAIVILFFIILLIICLHLHVRRTHLQARRRHRRRRRQSHLVFYENPTTNMVLTRGLDSSVLMSLPVFTYSSKSHIDQTECPVCLSEFEDGETGRVLPKCNHSFHVECIDMWFKTHSTCPLCRADVEPGPVQLNRAEVVIDVREPEIQETEPSSSNNELCLEMPKTGENFGEELTGELALTQSSVRSPVSRMLSFKRMLSWDRKCSVSPSAAGVDTAGDGGCGSDIEKDGGVGGSEGDVAVFGEKSKVVVKT